MKSTDTRPVLPIIFEDDHLLIINKPAGVLSQADRTGDPDVLSLCKTYLAKKSPNRDEPYLGLLHRLDRPVSGLMMLAKAPQAAKRISQQMQGRLIQKTYHTIVQGHPPANGVLAHHLLKNHQSNVVQPVAPDHPRAKKAFLSFVTLKEADNLSLLSVHLQTGRTHQIRVQLAAEGYPIWGDYKYGGNQPDGRAMALQAHELIFEHPATGEEMKFRLAHPYHDVWKLLGDG